MAVQKGNRWGLWIIVILLIIGLGGWYTGGAGGRTSSIGTVGDLEISAQDYATALRNQMRRIEAQTGQPMTFAQAQSRGLDRATLAQLVTERTLDAEARRLGLSVGDERVARAVLGMGAFQGIDGQFDRELYREALRRNGLTEERFEQSLREDTTRTILQAAVLSGLPEPTAYGETIAAWSNERRTATWAALSTAQVAIAPRATEEELRAFYEASPDLFTAPETRQVSYAWLTPGMIQDSVPVEDEAVRDLYDQRIDQFVQEERRLVERLVMPSEEAAQDARARLDAGEAAFEDLVEQRNLQLSDTDLGDVARRDLGGAADAVFAAQPGDVVGPVPTNLGPAFFRVNAVLAADETPFEEAAPDLRAEIADELARERITDLVPQVEDLVAGGATVADLAERTDLEPGEMALAQGSTEGPAAYDAFRSAAFALGESDLPEIVELEDGGLAVLSLDGITPPTLLPFEEVRDDVQAAWQAGAILEQVQARAEAAAQAIAGGASFEDQGLAPNLEENLTRRSQVEGAAPGFTEAVFAMQPGEARAVPTGDGALVVRLDALAPADEAAETVQAEAAAIAEEVSGGLSQDLFDAYARTLQTGTEIRIDDRAVAAVHAQFN
jgi:peptidyl-prolyl cis-trans isomerase D